MTDRESRTSKEFLVSLEFAINSGISLFLSFNFSVLTLVETPPLTQIPPLAFCWARNKLNFYKLLLWRKNMKQSTNVSQSSYVCQGCRTLKTQYKNYKLEFPKLTRIIPRYWWEVKIPGFHLRPYELDSYQKQ